MGPKDTLLDIQEPDGMHLTTEVPCLDLGNGMYRVEGIPVPSQTLDFGDEFTGELKDGVLHVRNVVRKSGWRWELYVLRRGDREAAWLVALCDKVTRLGGLWTWFCGMLAISLPPTVTYDPIEDFPPNPAGNEFIGKSIESPPAK